MYYALAMSKTKKRTNLKVTGTITTKDKMQRQTRKAGKEASTSDSSENPKEVMLSKMRTAG